MRPLTGNYFSHLSGRDRDSREGKRKGRCAALRAISITMRCIIESIPEMSAHLPSYPYESAIIEELTSLSLCTEKLKA